MCVCAFKKPLQKCRGFFIFKLFIMTKLRDEYGPNKYAVREFMFSFFKFTNIVGLAGLKVSDYIEWCKDKGYTSFEIWEIHVPTVFEQLKVLKAHEISYKVGDIVNASPDRTDTLYDLDYCVSTLYMKEPIQKFKKNFIMTFSTRIGIQKTIDTFFSAREESIVSKKEKTSPMAHTIFNTNSGGKYIFVKYADTSAMCCFAKIN